MATDVSLILFDLRSRGGGLPPEQSKVAVILQVGQGLPRDMSLLDAHVPVAARQVHLDNIAQEADRVRDILAKGPVANEELQELQELRTTYGRAVFDWLLQHEAHLADIAELARGGKRVRICTPYDAPRLRSFPFELMEPGPRALPRFGWLPNAPLAVSEGWSLVRSLPMEFRVLKPREVEKLVVLLVAQEAPKGFGPLNVEKEFNEIRAVLNRVEQVEVLDKLKPNPSLAEVNRVVSQHPVHCIHFIGHGCTLIPGTETPGLVFCGPSREALYVDPGMLRTAVLSPGPGGMPRLVFLNACHTEGFSSDLLRGGVPAVVATPFQVSDGACVTFAQEFYKSLVAHGDIEAAVLSGRRQLYFAHSVQWASYALYLQATDGKLFEPKVQPAPARPGEAREPALPELEWVHVPGGAYSAGSRTEDMRAVLRTFGMDDPDNLSKLVEPLQERNVPEFWITKHPVTNELYESYARSEGLSSGPLQRERQARPRHPVTHITWEEARQFARWMGCGLPTVEQWEKAARGPDDRRYYPWGPSFDRAKCTCAEGGSNGTTEVGCHADAESPYGVADMVGNVMEWLADEKDGGRFAACKGAAFDTTCEIFGMVQFTVWVEKDFADDDRGLRLVSTGNPAQLARGNHVVAG